MERVRPALKRMSSAPSAPRAHTLSDFDFELPPELIAQYPAAERSASRLLDGRQAQPVDRIFRELPALLQPGDLLVFNDTQVVKARLFGEKPSGGKLELLAAACAEAGVLGALAGVMGSLMAMEVIRAVAGFGEPLVGRLLMVDARAMRFETLTYGWDPENPLSGSGASAA